jgi:hypothetical protein
LDDHAFNIRHALFSGQVEIIEAELKKVTVENIGLT